MSMKLDWNYPAHAAIEIKDGPVLGYHILMVMWDMATEDNRVVSYRHHMEPTIGYSFDMVLSQQLNLGFLINAFGTEDDCGVAIDPREPYKEFRVCSRYLILGDALTKQVKARLRQSAKQFGKSILMYLDAWRRLDPPPLEGFVCQFRHLNLHQAVMVPSQNESGNEIVGVNHLVCPTHGVVEDSRNREWQMLPLFPEDP